MNWIAVAARLPEPGFRVLTYSPVYEGKDPVMLYRVMDSQFVRISGEVTHWCIPTPPEKG